MTDYTLEQLNTEAAAMAEQYLSDLRAANDRMMNEAKRIIAACDAAGLDPSAAEALIAVHLRRMEKQVEKMQ